LNNGSIAFEIFTCKAALRLTLAEVPLTLAEVPLTLAEVPLTLAEVPLTLAEVPLTLAEVPLTLAEVPLTLAEVPLTLAEVPLTLAEVPLTLAEVPLTLAEVPLTLAERILVKGRALQKLNVKLLDAYPTSAHEFNRPLRGYERSGRDFKGVGVYSVKRSDLAFKIGADLDFRIGQTFHARAVRSA
jgi:hypothetical protein